MMASLKSKLRMLKDDYSLINRRKKGYAKIPEASHSDMYILR